MGLSVLLLSETVLWLSYANLAINIEMEMFFSIIVWMKILTANLIKFKKWWI